MSGILRIAGLIEESIADGPGVRFVVFTQGCPHGCPGCHNPDTHDFFGGYEIQIDEIVEKIKRNELIDGVTISGGEPFCQTRSVIELVKKLKDLKYHIIIYSGFTLEQLIEKSKKDKNIIDLLNLIDILIDGRFEKDKRDYSLKFRGSSNQRIINLRDVNIKF